MENNNNNIFHTPLYMTQMRPVLNRNALFSDETEYYRFPAEPEKHSTVTIQFRAAKDNIDMVYLVVGQSRYIMNKYKTEGMFDYYNVSILLDEETIRYYFEISVGRMTCYYNKLGVTRDVQEYYSFMIIPGFKTPDWAKGAVIYQIYTDRFCNGDPTNDVENREYIYIQDGTTKVENWNKYPDPMDVRAFYGGDLQGVINKMDYLKELGIDAIYFNPLFVSPSNHKYDIQDYDYIDPHLGKIVSDGGETLKDWENDNKLASKYIKRVTDKANLEASNELFAELVRIAHEKGIRVILDGVFNHCGSFNKWMDRELIYEKEEGYEKGAFVSADSPYRSFFRFYSQDAWPYNSEYDGWWGHSTLPKLNYEESPILFEYIMNVAKKWVSDPYNVDGWRLDVAADLGHSNEYNHRFWKSFRESVKSTKPEAIILAEHYGDPKEWLQGDEWDTVMNYDAFMEPVTWFITGLEKHSDEYREDLKGNADSFFGAMRHHMASFTGSSLYVSMNELSNHDHSRFLTRTNGKVGRIGTLGPEAANEGINKGRFKEAVVIQMTWPGAPTIYYGDEAGVCGFTDPDSRRTYPWGNEDMELINFHKAVIAMHKSYRVFSYGSIKFLHGDYNILAYGRFSDCEHAVVVINNNDHDVNIEVEAWIIGLEYNSQLKRIMLTTEEGFETEEVPYKMDGDLINVSLPKFSSIVLINA